MTANPDNRCIGRRTYRRAMHEVPHRGNRDRFYQAGGISLGAQSKVTDPEKLTLLYERFRDVCLIEKEVWKEVFLPREMTSGPVRTNLQDRYDVEIDAPIIKDILEANIPLGRAALMAAIHGYRSHISFIKRS